MLDLGYKQHVQVQIHGHDGSDGFAAQEIGKEIEQTSPSVLLSKVLVKDPQTQSFKGSLPR